MGQKTKKKIDRWFFANSCFADREEEEMKKQNIDYKLSKNKF